MVTYVCCNPSMLGGRGRRIRSSASKSIQSQPETHKTLTKTWRGIDMASHFCLHWGQNKTEGVEHSWTFRMERGQMSFSWVSPTSSHWCSWPSIKLSHQNQSLVWDIVVIHIWGIFVRVGPGDQKGRAGEGLCWCGLWWEDQDSMKARLKSSGIQQGKKKKKKNYIGRSDPEQQDSEALGAVGSHYTDQ